MKQNIDLLGTFQHVVTWKFGSKPQKKLRLSNSNVPASIVTVTASHSISAYQVLSVGEQNEVA